MGYKIWARHDVILVVSFAGAWEEASKVRETARINKLWRGGAPIDKDHNVSIYVIDRRTGALIACIP